MRNIANLRDIRLINASYRMRKQSVKKTAIMRVIYRYLCYNDNSY